MRIKCKQNGFILPIILFTITALVGISVHLVQLSLTVQEQHIGIARAQAIALAADRLQTVQRAAALLAAESTLPTDGYPLPPAPATGVSPPTGGGFVPPSSKAPRNVGGQALGYCAYDNGATTNTVGYLAGTNSPASIALTVISAGVDGIFQTTCAQSSTNLPQGDDVVVVYATTQIRKQTDLPT
jgi:hypothetical protein